MMSRLGKRKAARDAKFTLAIDQGISEAMRNAVIPVLCTY